MTAVVLELANDEVSVASSDNENEESEMEVEESNLFIDNSDSEVDNDELENSKKTITKSGWADSISKILHTNKPKRKKTLVLSKAKKLNEVVIKDKESKPDFEIVGNDVDNIDIKETKNIKLENEPTSIKKKKKLTGVCVKPDVLDRNRERALAKIATRGVVQLFNAVRTHQKDIKAKLDEAGPLEVKRAKVLKNVDKNAFLNVLMGGKNSKSTLVDNPVKKETVQVKQKSDSNWNVLRDDFMSKMAPLKNWDKEVVDDEEVEQESEMESCGSDSD